MTPFFSRWTLWVGIAVLIQLWISVPYIGTDISQRFGFAEFVTSFMWQVGLVGGALFRAGMLYGKAEGSGESPAPPDAP